jgi:hypothetical protein
MSKPNPQGVQEIANSKLKVLMLNEDSHRYSIPMRFRKMENLHIVFWLFKDVAWCMVWKPLGILMIFLHWLFLLLLLGEPNNT